MRDAIIQELQARLKPVILRGDCQLDIPGYSATKGAYTFIDYNYSSFIIPVLQKQSVMCQDIIMQILKTVPTT